MKNTAFYVSGSATRLKKFLNNYINKLPDTDIKFILIDNTTNVELRHLCKKNNITIYENDLKNINDKNLFISDLFLNYLKKHNCHYAFVFATKILTGNLLNIYKDRLINFHPSILPSFKGISAIDIAITNKSFLLGNSAHFITTDIDNGSVIMQNIMHHTFYIDYNSILDNQLMMLLQLIQWLNDDRIYVKNGYAIVKDADYSIGYYTPKLEIEM